MTTSLLAALTIFALPTRREGFRRNRRTASLVEFAELVESAFALRDADGAICSLRGRASRGRRRALGGSGAIRQVFGEIKPLLDLVADRRRPRSDVIVVPTARSQRIKRCVAFGNLRLAGSGTRRGGRSRFNVTIE